MTTRSLLALLLTGLTLTACEKMPDPAAPETSLAGKAPADASPPNRNLDPRQVVRGRVVYDRHCAECHGAAGKGQAGDWRVRDAKGNYPPPPLDDSAHAWHHPTAALLEAIREGSPQGEGNMPAWKGKLSEQAMEDVVVYIKSLWSDPVYQMWWKMERQSLEQ